MKINSVINKFKIKKFTFISAIYFFFILLISLVSAYYCYLINLRYNIGDGHNNIIFDTLQFDHAILIKNLYANWDYSQYYNGIKYSLARLPALPLFLTLLTKLSKNIYFIFILKSVIVYSVYYFICHIYCVSNKKNIFFFFILLIIPILIPYNFHVGLSIFFEDCIIAVILPSLFLILVSNSNKRLYIAGIFLFVLYLTKTSMFFLTILLSLLILFLEKYKNIKSYVPIFAVFLAICGWGAFGFFKTGRIPFMLSTITINPVVMSDVVMNKEFKNYYPKKSVDLIPKEFFMPENITNEWDAYDYYKKKNSEFLKKNYSEYILQIPVKIKFILFNIIKDGVFSDNNGNFNNPIVVSYIFNKIFLNLALAISALTIFINWKIIFFSKKGFLNFKNDIYYIALFILNIVPHVIGWATSKHLVGITIASMIYLFLKFFKSKTNS